MRFSSIVFFLFVIIQNIVAQTKTGKEIDQLLYGSYAKLENYRFGVDSYSYDSIGRQGAIFREQLMKYTAQYPVTISMKFDSLKSKIDILTSSDGSFRIYSWDTWMGGTMHDFENLMQYRYQEKVLVKSIRDTMISSDDGYVYDFIKLYTLKENSKVYYLGVYVGVFSSQDAGIGIKFFTIDNKGLNETIKLIKTGSGIQNSIYFNFNLFKMGKVNAVADLIKYDAGTKTIYMRAVTVDEKVSGSYIKYQFKGEYFEKIH